MPDYFMNAEGNFFLQEELTEPFAWLTCTGVGDISIPQGDRTPIYCPDPLNSGDFKIAGFVIGDQGAGTYTLEKPLTAVWNQFLEMVCDFQGRINWVCRGSRTDPTNYSMAALLVGSTFNTKGISNPVRTPDGTSARVLTNGSVDFQRLMLIYRVNISRHTLINTADGNGLFFLPQRCEDRCGPARGLCDYGVMGLDNPSYPGYLYDAEIKKTENGSTWAATGTDPYAYGGGTRAVWIFETATGTRIVVMRQTPVAGHPPECAFSTDEGLTWTNVEMAAVNGLGINSCTLVSAVLVAVGSGGYVYTTDDQGTSWTVADAGAAAATQDLNDVDFYDDRKGYAVGDANAFIYTDDGGATWVAGTGPAVAVDLLSVAVNRKGYVYVTTDDGRIFYSTDEGVTWNQRLNYGAGTIPWIEFDSAEDYVGVFVHNPAAGRGQLYRSEDGGATWWQVGGMPDNSGLNHGFMCDQNHIVVAGNVHGGTTFVASTTPSS